MAGRSVATGGSSDGSVRAHLRAVVDRARPLTSAGEPALPVLPPLVGLLPWAGLQRGSTLSVGGGCGATSLAMALAAGPSAAGSWVAVVGLPALGLAAAAEVGLDLTRLAVIAPPEPKAWATVVAALVDAFEVVLVAPPGPVAHGQARRLAARARERGAVLVVVGSHAAHAAAGRRPPVAAPEVDLQLTVATTAWTGPGQGWGSLRARHMVVEVAGRRNAGRTSRVGLWLPSADGRVELQVGTPAVPGPVAATSTNRRGPGPVAEAPAVPARSDPAVPARGVPPVPVPVRGVPAVAHPGHRRVG